MGTNLWGSKFASKQTETLFYNLLKGIKYLDVDGEVVKFELCAEEGLIQLQTKDVKERDIFIKAGCISEIDMQVMYLDMDFFKPSINPQNRKDCL